MLMKAKHAALLLPISLLFAGSPTLAVSDGQTGIFDSYLARAENGDRDAQFIIGQRYERGIGVEKDIEKSNMWYAKAAAGGHALAQWKIDSQKEVEQKAVADAKAEKDKATAAKAAEEARAKEAQAAKERAAKKKEAAAVAAAKPASATPAPAAKVAAASEAVTPAPAPAPEPAINAMEVVMAGHWQRDRLSAELLPSGVASCIPVSAAEVVCFSNEVKRNIGGMQYTYTVKSELSRFGKDGSFMIHYRYNVSDMSKGAILNQDDGKTAPGLEPKMGWQEPGHTAACKVGRDSAISCVTDRKVALNFSRL